MPLRLDYPSLIVESVSSLESSLRRARYRQNIERIRFLWYLKTGAARSLASAGSLIGLRSRQSQTLWRLYREGGLENLLVKTSRRSWGKLSSVQIGRLLQYLDTDMVKTQQEIATYLQDTFGVHYTQAGISLLLKRVKVKLKTGRPSNVRKVEGSEEAFKKNASPLGATS